jgi:hypothetical protein
MKFPRISKESGVISLHFTHFVKPFLNSNTASLAVHLHISSPHPVAVFLSSDNVRAFFRTLRERYQRRHWTLPTRSMASSPGNNRPVIVSVNTSPVGSRAASLIRDRSADRCVGF